jgi:CBS domain-containing protein
MSEANVGALVVKQDDKLVGIISERDYARKIVLKGRTSPDTPVSAIMSKSVVCATPDQTIEECMGLMTAKAIRHLPVLDHKKIVGIVSIGDLVKAIIGEQQFVIEQLESYIHGH